MKERPGCPRYSACETAQLPRRRHKGLSMNTEHLPNSILSDKVGFSDGSRGTLSAHASRDGASGPRLTTGPGSEAEPDAAVPGDAVAMFHSECHIRNALKWCSAPTRDAACAFRRTGNVAHLPTIIDGLIEHYAEPGSRSKLRGDGDSLRLVEDLGIDSLTMLEIVFLAEDVLQVSIDNDELRPFRTVGDIKRFIATKLAAAS
jgi:acyl carrier protein